MSEMASERTTRGGSSGAFTQKLGPLPLWGWMGIGLAVALVFYFWNKNKQSSSAASQTSTSTESGTTEPADQVPPYIIQNYESDVNAQTVGPTTTNVNPTAPPTPPPPPTTIPPTSTQPSTGQVTVPNLMGERANFAIGNLKSIGLVGLGKTDRNPKNEYEVSGQSIPAGTKVPKGTKVTLQWKQVATGKT